MVTTRSRKRGTGEDTVTRKSASNVVEHIDQEPSVLPKAKRARTGAKAGGETINNTKAAGRTRKGRALKPVATNANHQHSNVAAAKASSTSTTTTNAPKPQPAGKATKPVAAKAKSRGRPPTKKHSHKRTREPLLSEQEQPAEEDNPPSRQQQHQQPQQQQAAIEVRDPVATEPTAVKVDVRASNISSSSYNYQNGTPDDIDARDVHDPLSVTDYVEDMYEHFRSKEGISSVGCMYMGRREDGKQPNINESMRCILVDWLIEVHYKFKLFPETLYLTVNILDRFLAQTHEVITKRDLQLVGVTSLLVSAKYEEMYVPELRDLTYICDGAYTEAKILRMEEKILKTLNYNVTVPTPHTFLIRFLKAAHADKLMAQLACFLLDGTLLSLETLTCRWRPSQLAAAAILLARRQLGRHNWSPTLVFYSRYREEDVLPVARALLQNKHRLEENRELMALAKKYSKTKFGKVSHYVFLPLETTDLEPSSSEAEDVSIDHSDL